MVHRINFGSVKIIVPKFPCKTSSDMSDIREYWDKYEAFKDEIRKEVHSNFTDSKNNIKSHSDTFEKREEDDKKVYEIAKKYKLKAEIIDNNKDYQGAGAGAFRYWPEEINWRFP